MSRILVVPHDPSWAALFEAEAARIRAVAAAYVAAVHHIGSTSVPGIAAKPIIDILVEAADAASLDRLRAGMTALGYDSLGEFGIAGRRYFRKDDATGTRTHHVHAFAAGDPHVRRHLAFRDYLVAHPDVARAYSSLKEQLAAVHTGDSGAYVSGKDPFIKEHEARALAWAGR